MAQSTGAAITFTPNDAFRRVRRMYVTCILVAVPMLFLAFVTTVQKIGYGVLPIVLLVGGIGLLIVAMLSRAAASCPRCSTSLMWKKGPFGTGHLSLREKSHCPNCGLDLNASWSMDADGAVAVGPDGKTQ
jgi:ribosomal protein S27AE